MSEPLSNKPNSKEDGPVLTGTETTKTVCRENNSIVPLRRNLRAYASTLIVLANDAKKLDPDAVNDDKKKRDESTESLIPEEAEKKMLKALKDSVRTTLKQKQTLREKSAVLEGKLRGNAKESHAFHCLLRSQSCVGTKRRKFSITTDE